MRAPNSKAVLGIIFLTVFLDLVGFGIVLPLLPFYATDMGATPLVVGLIISSYSAMQFLFSLFQCIPTTLFFSMLALLQLLIDTFFHA